MAVKTLIREVTLDSAAQVFKMDRAELEEKMDLDLITELGATSQQYFPIINALEDELDIELQYQDFRRSGRTLNTAIDHVERVYIQTYGE